MSDKNAVRGAMLTFKADPFFNEVKDCLVYEPDALIVMEKGKISAVGPAGALLPLLPQSTPVTRYHDSLIIPGFIDCHAHYPQAEIIASHGEQLIDWLNNYTFIAEQNYADKSRAAEAAEFFLNEQLRNGVTSSAVYCAVYPQSVDALFEEAQKRGLRIIAGKVCMDRNAPESLLDTPQRAYDDSKALIEKWHKKGRAAYAITPRFAPTSSPEQLEAVGALAREYPDAYIQSHVAENSSEAAWVKSLYPKARNYTEVYSSAGLLRERAIYGHGIHLSEDEFTAFSESGAAITHCPTSNFFLGSGCFNLKKAKDPKRPVRVALGTDIGAGTSFSMLQTMGEAYKAAQLNGYTLSAAQAFYLAGKGAAETLRLEDKIGSIAPGLEADLTVLNLKSTPLIEYRMRYAKDLAEVLFIQMTLGDDRAVAAVYVAGRLAYSACGA